MNWLTTLRTWLLLRCMRRRLRRLSAEAEEQFIAQVLGRMK